MSRSCAEIIASENRSKYIESRLSRVEHNFGKLCSSFSSYTRKTARLRDKGDEMCNVLRDYVDSELINMSTKNCVHRFTENLATVQDYRQAQVNRLEANVIKPMISYGGICRDAKADIRAALTALEKEQKSVKYLQRTTSRHPTDDTLLYRAKADVDQATLLSIRTGKDLQVKTDLFERKKLHDMKKMMLDFVKIEMIFHAKALEVYTNCYNAAKAISPENDLVEFRKYFFPGEDIPVPGSYPVIGNVGDAFTAKQQLLSQQVISNIGDAFLMNQHLLSHGQPLTINTSDAFGKQNLLSQPMISNTREAFTQQHMLSQPLTFNTSDAFGRQHMLSQPLNCNISDSLTKQQLLSQQSISNTSDALMKQQVLSQPLISNISDAFGKQSTLSEGMPYPAYNPFATIPPSSSPIPPYSPPRPLTAPASYTIPLAKSKSQSGQFQSLTQPFEATQSPFSNQAQFPTQTHYLTQPLQTTQSPFSHLQYPGQPHCLTQPIQTTQPQCLTQPQNPTQPQCLTKPFQTTQPECLTTPAQNTTQPQCLTQPKNLTQPQCLTGPPSLTQAHTTTQATNPPQSGPFSLVYTNGIPHYKMNIENNNPVNNNDNTNNLDDNIDNNLQSMYGDESEEENSDVIDTTFLTSTNKKRVTMNNFVEVVDIGKA